eukprot:39791_1
MVHLGTIYDILAITISIADVTTDVWITYEYYIEGRTIFFQISLFIIGMAQLSYCITFALRCMKQYGGLSEFVTCCFCAIPFAPFISIILYLFHDPETCCSRVWTNSTVDEIFNLSDDMLQFGDLNQSEFNRFLMKKLSAHIGFIIEAWLEAFPQSLLQMIAIVYYNKADYISIISILISMLSVTTKSFVFSKGLNMTQFIFTWFCVCTDFFGMFFAIAWAFNREDDGSYTAVGQIYFYKLLFGSLPIAIFLSIFMYFYVTPKWFDRVCAYGCGCCTCIFAFVLSIFGFIVGCVVLCLLSEILTFTLLAFLIYYFGTTRFLKYDQEIENRILQNTIQFIQNGRSSHDRELRVFCINAEYYHSYRTLDKQRKAERYKYAAWIDEMEEKQSLECITYENMRMNAMNESHQRHANFWNHLLLKTLYEHLREEIVLASQDNKSETIRIYGCFMLVAVFPLYVLSKVITVLYPLIIGVYIAIRVTCGYDMMDMAMFQVIMLIIYASMLAILVVLGVITCQMLWPLWHIAPGDESIIIQRFDIEKFEKYYDKMMLVPFIENLANIKFGADVARIIMEYYAAIQQLAHDDI